MTKFNKQNCPLLDSATLTDLLCQDAMIHWFFGKNKPQSSSSTTENCACAAVIDPSTGYRVTRTKWRDQLHSVDDKPAVIETDPKSGKLLREQYFKHGKLHREDNQPAYIEYSPTTGHVTLEVFCRNGKIYGGTNETYAIDYNPETGEPITYDKSRPGSPPLKR